MTKKIQDAQSEEQKSDLTAQREERVKSVVRFILQKMLDENLLFDDVNYVEAKIKQHLEMVISNMIVELTNETFQTLVGSLRMSFNLAQEKLWKKLREEISIKDINDVLEKKSE